MTTWGFEPALCIPFSIVFCCTFLDQNGVQREPFPTGLQKTIIQNTNACFICIFNFLYFSLLQFKAFVSWSYSTFQFFFAVIDTVKTSCVLRKVGCLWSYKSFHNLNWFEFSIWFCLFTCFLHFLKPIHGIYYINGRLMCLKIKQHNK